MGTESIGDAARRRWEAVKEWWNSLFPPDDSYKRRHRDPEPEPEPPQPPPTRQPSGQEGARYEVSNSDGSLAHQADQLTDALNAWRDLTHQQGSILDTETGEDLTPEKDENGRYAVMDEDGNQVGTFNDFDVAERVWETDTNGEGSIIDTLMKTDVTPYKGHLTDEEVAEAIAIVRSWGGRGFTRSFSRDPFEVVIDRDEVARLIPIINKMRLPIFELANAIGDSHDLPTSTVTVTKREAEITYKEVPYFEDVPVQQPPTTFRATPLPQDRRERRPMRAYDELTRVRPTELAMPDFERRFAMLELPVEDHMEEVPGDVPTKKVRKTRMEQTITPREWEEEIEVTDEPRVQNLAVVADLSGSMAGQRINVAVALVVVLITKHLHDESRYSFRWFANYVDKPSSADTTRGKRKLIEFVMDTKSTTDIGGGTNILGGIEAAASDVRSFVGQDEIPEILVVSDGDDWHVTAESVFACIGTDVILHALMVDGDNMALRSHSSTYDRIDTWNLGGGVPRSFLDDGW